MNIPCCVLNNTANTIHNTMLITTKSSQNSINNATVNKSVRKENIS